MSEYPYDVGDVARITAAFTSGGVLIDPDDLSFEITAPAEAAVLHVYSGSPGGSGSPAEEIIKDGVGEYHIDISLDVAGTYTYRWVATGTGQNAIYGSLRVPSFVSLQQAKDHIRDTSAEGSSGDNDLLLKLDAAETLVLDYIGSTSHWRTQAAAWTNATIPIFVRQAILVQFADLWRFRGDDVASQAPARDPNSDLSPTVVALLRRTRDPVVI